LIIKISGHCTCT